MWLSLKNRIGRVPVELLITEVHLPGEALDLLGYYRCNETRSSPAPPSPSSSPGSGQSLHLALSGSLPVSAGEQVGRAPPPSCGRSACIWCRKKLTSWTLSRGPSLAGGTVLSPSGAGCRGLSGHLSISCCKCWLKRGDCLSPTQQQEPARNVIRTLQAGISQKRKSGNASHCISKRDFNCS